MSVGIDAQPVAEVRESLEMFGDSYRSKLFTDQEIASCGGWGASARTSAEGLAARFAAKEATFKALRVDARVPLWKEVEVVTANGGWPSLRLTGLADELAHEGGIMEFQVSLSHTLEIALAVVIALR